MNEDHSENEDEKDEEDEEKGIISEESNKNNIEENASEDETVKIKDTDNKVQARLQKVYI